MKYIQVCKALYDYEARTEEELTVQEEDILYVIEKEDDEWWKTELKQSNGEEPGPVGLVPANYLEDVVPIGVVRAEYDYEAQQEEELSFEEGTEMELIENDDPDWYLVKMKNGEIGLAPSNYVVDANITSQEVEKEEQVSLSTPAPIVVATATAGAAIPVVTQSPIQPIKSHITGTPREPILDEAQSWTVHEYDQAKKKKKKDKGNLLIGNGMICYGSETDKSLPVQQYPILDVTKYLVDGKILHLEIEGNRNAVYDFQLSSKSEAKAVLVKINESTKAAQVAGMKFNNNSRQMSTTSIPSPPPIVRPVTQPTFQPIVQPVSQPAIQHHIPVHDPVPEPNCTPKWGISIYSFNGEGGEELSVEENEQLYVLDYERPDGWWQVQKVDGEVGIIPSSYVQFDDEDNSEGAPDNVNDIRRKREEEERELKNRRLAEERKREEQKRREQEERERRFEEDNRKREEESRRKQQEEERRRQVQEAAKRAEEERIRQVEEEYRRTDLERKASRSVSKSGTASRSSTVSRSNTVSKSHQDLSKPDPTKVRTWTDRSGTFKVEAQLIDFHDGKLRLHKLNGVKIDVPVGKMCAEDVRWLEQQQRRQTTSVQESQPILSQSSQKKLNKRWDWFDWFMAIGIPMQASLQYASSFKAEKLDDSDVNQLTHKQMKTLGLKEEHVRRVERFIETGTSEDPEEELKKKKELQSQLETDEELARKLQSDWQSPGSSNSKPTSRPRPPLSAPNAVHPDLLEFVGAQLSSSSVPTISSTSAPVLEQSALIPTQVAAIKAKEPETPQNSSRGFNDDAWAPRSDASPLPPASTPVKPMVPIQAIQPVKTGPSQEEIFAAQKAEEQHRQVAEEKRKKLAEEEQIQKIQIMSLKKQAQEQQKQLEELQQLTQQQLGLQQQLAMQTGNQQKHQQQMQQMQQVQTQQQQLQQQLQQQTMLPQNIELQKQVQQQQQQVQQQQQQVQQQQQQLQQQPPAGRQRPTAPTRMSTDPSLGQWQSSQQTGFQPSMNISQPQPQSQTPQQLPIQTGYQNPMAIQQQQQPAWQSQQLQSQITGFPITNQPAAYNFQQPMATATVSVASILPQPLTPTVALQRPQIIGAQPTGRHWNSATPENPFGSPTPSNLTPQMTGVQFSTPNPQSFNPTVLQAQMTGQPSHSIFTPQGSMQYGQSAFPNNQRRW